MSNIDKECWAIIGWNNFSWMYLVNFTFLVKPTMYSGISIWSEIEYIKSNLQQQMPYKTHSVVVIYLKFNLFVTCISYPYHMWVKYPKYLNSM